MSKVDSPMPQKDVDGVFGDLELAIQQIQDAGSVELNDENEVIFYPFGGDEAFPLANAIRSIIDTIDLIDLSGKSTAGLYRLWRGLTQNSGVELDTGGALDSLLMCRAAAVTVSHRQFGKILEQSETIGLIREAQRRAAEEAPELLAA